MVGCGRCCQLRRNARGFPVSGDQKQAQPIPDAPVPWLQQSPWATPQPAQPGGWDSGCYPMMIELFQDETARAARLSVFSNSCIASSRVGCMVGTAKPVSQTASCVANLPRCK